MAHLAIFFIVVLSRVLLAIFKALMIALLLFGALSSRLFRAALNNLGGRRRYSIFSAMIDEQEEFEVEALLPMEAMSQEVGNGFRRLAKQRYITEPEDQSSSTTWSNSRAERCTHHLLRYTSINHRRASTDRMSSPSFESPMRCHPAAHLHDFHHRDMQTMTHPYNTHQL
ncbi:hypothetical protein FA10DRAFT_189474 [Acaromyces ingoldii]|uniref:Uncharacterized protein n=1 Tax=Acaromyces ingoldii TaxID=215250 RepID=A0A316YDL7_9BASI|nr:hypothetical protein FA10DRAFT_189474 [Acaromyces ingoldii]PWN87596.1 hypothetical protein FA10DRAFT_189474 [Acaromyces ingoldii]